jgi:hypothetical protein
MEAIMADYYTQFSCELDLGTVENAKRALDIYSNSECDDGSSYNEGFDLSVMYEPNEHVLWIWAEDQGNPDHVVAFVKACALALDLKGLWGFDYANSCSLPALEAFGGGAHVLNLTTGETVGFMDTQSWLAFTLADAASAQA